MTKTLERKKIKYLTTGVSSRSAEYHKLSGDNYQKDASDFFSAHEYRVAALSHRNAVRCYTKALECFDENPRDNKDISRRDIQKLLDESKKDSRKSYRMAALWEVTKNRNPIVRGLIRRIKGIHVIASFILALFFVDSKITGNVVGSDYSIPFFGMFFFFVGVFLIYFFAWKNILFYKYQK